MSRATRGVSEPVDGACKSVHGYSVAGAVAVCVWVVLALACARGATAAVVGASGNVVGASGKFQLSAAQDVPGAITAGRDGNIWFTEALANAIGRITPSGTISEFPLPTREGAPGGITAGPDGNLWFHRGSGGHDRADHPERQDQRVSAPHAGSGSRAGSPRVRTATSGSPRGQPTGSAGSPRAARSASSRSPRRAAARADHGGPGRQPLVHRGGGQHDRADHPERHGQRVPASPAASLVGGITAGRDGNLWFFTVGATHDRADHPERARSASSRSPSAGGTPSGITAGPDGNVWFTEGAADTIGRITPSGKISDFPLPTRESLPSGITAGPDGNLWFTEEKANAIGRIHPASAPKCVVPRLRGKTLAQAKRLLRALTAGWEGSPSPPSTTHRPVVVAQKPAAKKALPSGAKVSLRLG